MKSGIGRGSTDSVRFPNREEIEKRMNEGLNVAGRKVIDGVLYRFHDLVHMGIVSNRTTLHRWIKAGRFPKPVKLTELTVAWRRRDIEAWLEQLSERT